MIKIDGKSESDYGLVALAGHSNPLAPVISSKAIKIPNKAGLLDAGSDIGIRQFNLAFGIKDTGQSAIQSKMDIFKNNLMENGKPKEVSLVFDYENDKYYKVKLTGGIDVARLERYNSFTVSLIANDPFKYSLVAKTIDIDNTPTIENQGTAPTTGIITLEITEDISEVEVKLNQTGEFVRVEHDFVMGDVVEIDLEKETVLKNDVSVMADCVLESDFFDIPVGNFGLSVTGGSATLEFTERWI